MSIATPKSIVIEETALQLAATWYEIGRGQGLKSKWPNAREYAKANVIKFIPNAVKILLDMLKPTSNCTKEMRDLIFDALMERHDDPELLERMPNIDIQKAIEFSKQLERNKPAIELKGPKDNHTILKIKGIDNPKFDFQNSTALQNWKAETKGIEHGKEKLTSGSK